MKGADGKPLKIVQTIAAHDYTTFGMCLLQDENGEDVALIEKDHIIRGAKSVTEAILQKWLTSDATPRTYQHLIDCLRQSELGALAELIEQGMLYRYESEYTQHHVNYYDQTQFTTEILLHQGFNRHTKTSQSQLERIEMKTLYLHGSAVLEINTNAL